MSAAPNKMTIVGDHEPKVIAQLKRCVDDAAGVRGVLCADGHYGYSMPVGGVVAYLDAVSPSGVGYDIGCLAAESRVTTEDGYTLAIRDVSAQEELPCWDGVSIRRVNPNLGAVCRGQKETTEIHLANGRTIIGTPDHEIRTTLGWRRIDQLVEGESLVACSPFVGLPYEEPFLLGNEGGISGALVRVLGSVSGDGHLTKDGKSVSFYFTDFADAQTVCRDLTILGFHGNVYTRQRTSSSQPEVHVKVGSVSLHRLLANLGSPVGKKVWDNQMAWLFDQPAWVRAQFLSAFCSAEMCTPGMHRSWAKQLAVKQAGLDSTGIVFVAALFRSLGFETTVDRSGKARGDRQDYFMWLTGGKEAVLKFLLEVGFCYHRRKRIAAASVSSLLYQSAVILKNRVLAIAEARRLKIAGGKVRAVVAQTAAKYGVPKSLVFHGLYERGSPRFPKNIRLSPVSDGEVYFCPVSSVVTGTSREVWDVSTRDETHSFFSEGIVVHNCGNLAVRTPLKATDVLPDVAGIMDRIVREIAFGIGRKAAVRVDDSLFADPTWTDVRVLGSLKDLARSQLGTVGSGNHYVDLFADENDDLWVGVHFGSRGFGHRTASGFLNLAAGRGFGDKAPGESMDQPPTMLSLASPLGSDYFAAMQLAGRYAYAGREAVVNQVLGILGTSAIEAIHNHHNFAWKELHDGQTVVVVRKGSTPNAPGQRSFIGGSMGDDSVIVEGLAVPDNDTLLRSTVHGAGRIMSRSQAAGSRYGKNKKPGLITRQMMSEWTKRKGVVVRGGGPDESPHVYRRLPDVLAQHASTIRIVHTLRPIGVAMAGADEIDPYKD